MSSDSDSDNFEDAHSDIELEAHRYRANRLISPIESDNESDCDSKENQTAQNYAPDPFEFISRLDVRAYVGAGGAQNRSGLGHEKQELERRETEEWRIKDAERNRQILMVGNLVEDLDDLNCNENNTLRFHKAGEAVENAKALYELDEMVTKFEVTQQRRAAQGAKSSPGASENKKASTFVLPPRPPPPQSFKTNKQAIAQQFALGPESIPEEPTKEAKEEQHNTRLHRSGRPYWEVKHERSLNRQRKDDLHNCPNGPSWSLGAVEPMGLVDGEAFGYYGLDEQLSSKALFPTGAEPNDEQIAKKRDRERAKRVPFVIQQFTREGTLAAAQQRVESTKPRAPKERSETKAEGKIIIKPEDDFVNDGGWDDDYNFNSQEFIEWDRSDTFKHSNLVPKHQLPAPRPYSTYCKPPQKPDTPYYERPSTAAARFAPPAQLTKNSHGPMENEFFARQYANAPFEEKDGMLVPKKQLVDYRDFGKKREPGANHVFVPVIDYSQPKYAHLFGVPGGGPSGSGFGNGNRGGFSRGSSAGRGGRGRGRFVPRG